MARITVEDCLERIDNRFQLVLIATKRARQLEKGHTPMVDPDNDKFTVIALREIAEGFVTEEILDEPDIPAVPLIGFDDEEEQGEEKIVAQGKEQAADAEQSDTSKGVTENKDAE